MTPLDFADEYYNVCVQYRDGQSQIPVMHFVRVEQYRINREQSSHHSDLAEKDRLVGRVRRAMREASRAGTNGPQQSDIGAIARSFFAKGSPADYETTLRCALLYGGTSADQLQQYADRRLGLDCSGFVNQYWIAIGSLNGYKNSKTIRQHGQANRRRSAITPEAGNPRDPRAIQPLDMLIWPDFGHIAIIDYIVTTSAGTQAVVVESTASNAIGPGLVHSTYRFNSVNASNKKFNVRRGNANTHVYVASFDPISR